MKVIYLSNHVGQLDFDLIVKNASRKPNPAGQNFHGKLIASLAKYFEVTCFSLVPSSEDCFEHKKGIKGNGIPHYYFYPPKRPIIPNALTIPPKIIRAVMDKFGKEKPEDLIIVYDTLNISLSRAAKSLAKKLGCKRLAVCTDDPFNISGTSDTYISASLGLSKEADGYFCLTKGLEELYNVKQRPFLIHMGIVEETPEIKPYESEKPYVYYGGALFYKDGTDSLLEAYSSLKANFNLILAGHGPSEKKAKELAEANEDIIFLGQVSKEENYSLEAGAELLINPRIYRAYLDKCSVPSKVMEYLHLGKHVASTLSTPIKDVYEEAIDWIPSDPEKAKDQLIEFFVSHMDENGNLINLKENTAQGRVLDAYGLEASGKLLYDFISSL